MKKFFRGGSAPLGLSVVALGIFVFTNSAHALPAFALREKVSCVVCHTNGSAPHLTKLGYDYRRAGFRFPSEIGNKERDARALTITEHLAAGTNVSYEVAVTKAAGTFNHTLSSNHFNTPEIEIWPLVGGFLGNFGFWTEFDANPNISSNHVLSGTVTAAQADLRYVVGSADLYFNFRGGLMASEGFGASDQWIDDANIPFIDKLTPNFNQDTLALPFGAMGVPRLGAEVGLNYRGSHLTLGLYNGFDGTNTLGAATPAQSTLSTTTTHPEARGAKDIKVQLDQFLGDFAFTAAYYKGYVSLLDPGNTVAWLDPYWATRLYLTSPPVFGFDLLGGLAYGQNDYVNTGTNLKGGSFINKGFFVGANYYPMQHLSLSARYDFFDNYVSGNSAARATGVAFMVSMPYEYNIFVAHFNVASVDISGLVDDFRLEWRFLF